MQGWLNLQAQTNAWSLDWPELGAFFLIVAFWGSILQVLLGLAWLYQARLAALGHSVDKLPQLLQSQWRSSLVVFISLCISFFLLALSFLTHDYSVAYVASNSHSFLPWWYQLSAVWGGHEGSLLLWVLFLSLWSWGFLRRYAVDIEQPFQVRLLILSALILLGFLALIILTSNPFDRTLPQVPLEGEDLNPLLQDIGLIFHPPLLYVGYVGFAVPFMIAVAALWQGQWLQSTQKMLEQSTRLAWAFLTVGILLGSWWAYYELGWGGWWFWDPVENASVMPWLSGAALLHALALYKRTRWGLGLVVFLGILSFLLSLLGTFLVRSGVLTSVHAFASDPTRGLFILGLLLFFAGGSLGLFAWRLPKCVENSSGKNRLFQWRSVETLLLWQQLLWGLALFVVFLGTLFPLIVDALKLGKLSVGPPYFNYMMTPLVSITLLGLGLMPFALTKKPASGRTLVIVLVGSIATTLLAWFVTDHAESFANNWIWLLLVWSLSFAVVGQLLVFKQAVFWRYPKTWGMPIAHMGFLVMMVGVICAGFFSHSKNLVLQPGQTIQWQGYEFELERLALIEGPNYESIRGVFNIQEQGKTLMTLYPEKRTYWTRGDILTEAGILDYRFIDFYISLGEAQDAEDQLGAWSVRIQYKPLIRWVWFGACISALGALIGFITYRRKKPNDAN
jgi:cytochrome c-type biogenesis protein CcmF